LVGIFCERVRKLTDGMAMRLTLQFVLNIWTSGQLKLHFKPTNKRQDVQPGFQGPKWLEVPVELPPDNWNHCICMQLNNKSLQHIR